MVPEPLAARHQVITFAKDATTLSVATVDPSDLEALEFIKRRSGLKLKVYLATDDGIREVLKQYHRSLEAELGTMGVATAPETGGEPNADLQKLAKDLPVVRLVDTILEYAIFEEASDIHIEPAEKELIVRYRIDGLLRDAMTLPKTIQAGLTARLKVLAGLKLDEHRLPQDGRFKLTSKDYKVSFRVSVLPVFDGEKVVMRLLNEGGKQLTLEQLGFQPTVLAKLKSAMAKPHGMILITGPTGSGKTTTLYTMMGVLNQPDVNISTVEDPIEYRMPRINQSQVQPKIGFSFANGLRSLLRQDPDIIMVGEIRDNETVQIAINASMTGHLVLSTLHTNDAATAIPRLLDMEVPAFLIASTVTVIIAQRLVRKLCPNCITSFNLNAAELKELTGSMNLEQFEQDLKKAGLLSDRYKGLQDVTFYRGKGCNQCGNEGYRGRLGIYEALEMTPAIQDLVMKHATSNEIIKTARAEGMLMMIEDGFLKAQTGVTSLEEVLRVTTE
jgi:type IV pilus assembly protein PilB